jgi:hypothetical protein
MPWYLPFMYPFQTLEPATAEADCVAAIAKANHVLLSVDGELRQTSTRRD